LRLRFLGEPERLTNMLLPRLCDWGSDLIATGRCHKFAFDTYEREVERYGGPDAAAASEAIFAADSQFVVDLLATTPLPERSLIAAVTIDALLGDIGLDNGSRLDWLKAAASSRNEVANEYRKKRTSLVAALCRPRELGASIHDALARRSKALGPTVEILIKMEATSVLTQPLSKLCESYVHMHCNRLGVDRTMERRVLGLLLRTRETITHLTKPVV
jgi:thiopeptide-type bacteriocin biosynthesis protein